MIVLNKRSTDGPESWTNSINSTTAALNRTAETYPLYVYCFVHSLHGDLLTHCVPLIDCVHLLILTYVLHALYTQYTFIIL